MEIAPVGRRRSSSRRLLLVLLSALLVWLVLIVVLPAVFGLRTFVATDDDAVTGVHRGTFLLARGEPTAEVLPGDLVLGGPPDRSPVWRVTSTPPGALVAAQSDATVTVAGLDQPTTHTVVLNLPLVGWPIAHLNPAGRGALVLAAVLALVLEALTLQRRKGGAETIEPGVPDATRAWLTHE